MTIQAARPTRPALGQPQRFLTDDLDISLIGDDTYCLLGRDDTLGFVQKRGNTYVGLLGDDMQRTLAIGESLSFDVTVAMVVSAYRS